MMKKFQIKARIVRNLRVKGRYFKMVLEAPRITKEAKPGQFVNIKVSDSEEPLLRRPFSIHRVPLDFARGRQGSGFRGQLEILYEVLGKGTEILSQRKAGGYLDIIGPLGKGFDYSVQRSAFSVQILVAGGMGIAPLMFLAEKLVACNLSGVTVLIGAKTKEQILCDNEFKKLGCEVKIATDDGSAGFRGKITGLLERLLSTMSYELSTIYACGPHPMLKEISRLSKEYRISAQISLDEHMACGIGACLGCVVKIKNPRHKDWRVRQELWRKKSKIKNDFEYKRVCKEGPVFNAEEIIW